MKTEQFQLLKQFTLYIISPDITYVHYWLVARCADTKSRSERSVVLHTHTQALTHTHTKALTKPSASHSMRLRPLAAHKPLNDS